MSQTATPIVETPWAEGSRSQFHPWHTMCSYLGSFPPQLARYFVERLSKPGDVVLDPFAGRGTTHLEARVAERVPYSSDLNPLAVALTAAKNADVDLQHALERVNELEQRFDLPLYLPIAQTQSPDIQLIFHPHTLAKLCFLRRALVESSDPVDIFLVGAILGIMHGAERSDGSSAYASISMPNTFSMSPNYVRKYITEKRLQRVDRNVFDLLREKVKRLFARAPIVATTGVVARADAKLLQGEPEYAPLLGKVRLVLTSPPYLNVVNYAKQNWIRLWFLGEDSDGVSDELDDSLPLGPWLDFMEDVLRGLVPFLAPNGAIVLVIGDVARSKSNVVSPARELLRRLHHDLVFSYLGAVSDYLNVDGKTTRIWKDTKGQATRVDRVVILSNSPSGNVGGGNLDVDILDTWARHAKEFAGLQ